MSSNSLIPVWTGVVLLSTILLMGQVCAAQTDPCNPDPCQSIPYAQADTCYEIGGACTGPSDFLCSCYSGYIWQDATNTCDGPPLAPSGVHLGECYGALCCELDSVDMWWGGVSGATYYEVGWGCSFDPTEIYNVGNTSFLDDVMIEIQLARGCGGDSGYVISDLGVRACNAHGCSAWSYVPSNEVPGLCFDYGCCLW